MADNEEKAPKKAQDDVEDDQMYQLKHYSDEGRLWDSRINFLSTSESSKFNLYEDDEEEEEEEDERSWDRRESGESDSIIEWESDVSWPDVVLPDTWGTQALEQIPWADWQRPVENVRNYDCLELNVIESEGVLTDRIVAACSSYLDRCPLTGKYVMCKCNLSGKKLIDIRILTFHHYLQYVDLSNNHIKDIEALGQLPFLMYLDVSRNFLDKVLDFKAPFNLTFVNFSYNNVMNIPDLSAFWSLVHLDLSHNDISDITGLDKLKYLRFLDLSFNNISCIENLNHMRLHGLNLRYNNIFKYEEGEDVGLKTLTELIYVRLGHNYLKTLELFVGASSIQEIRMVGNNIDDLSELRHLRGLYFLTEANFSENPIAKMPDYYDVCLNNMRSLFVLDGELINTADKVKATSRLNKSPRKIAARKEVSLLIMETFNEPLIGASVVPVNQPPPAIIVLVGPLGSHKGALVRLFCGRHERLTRLAVSHTTRPIREDEVDGVNYHFVSEDAIKKLISRGVFLSVREVLGNTFGFSHRELDKVLGKRAVLVMHSDLTAALILRSKGLRPRLVLAQTKTVEMHKLWLMEKYCYSAWMQGNLPGALLIENWPENCKKLFAETEMLSQQTMMRFVEEIIDRIPIDGKTADSSRDSHKDAFFEDKEDEVEGEKTPQQVSVKIEEVVKEMVLSERSSMASITDGQTQENEMQCEGKAKSDSFLSKDSRAMSGILKGPSEKYKKPVDVRENRTSVAFNHVVDLGSMLYENTLNEMHDAKSMNRSVTFSSFPESLRASEYKENVPYSISATMLSDRRGDGPSSNVALSALSGTHIPIAAEESVEQLTKVKCMLAEKEDRLTFFARAFNEYAMSWRDKYSKLHEANPGLFAAIIYTDDEENSLKTLEKILKDCVKEQPNATPVYTYRKDSVYKSMVEGRLRKNHEEIMACLSVGSERKPSSCKKKAEEKLPQMLETPHPQYSQPSELDNARHSFSSLQLQLPVQNANADETFTSSSDDESSNTLEGRESTIGRILDFQNN